MKVAHFTDTFYPKIDGIVTSIMNFSHRLITKGHSVRVFCPAYEDKKELHIRGLKTYRFYSVPLASYKEVRVVFPNLVRMYSIIKKEKPDVIHIHTPGFMGYLGTLFAEHFKIPCLGTYHTLVTEQLMYVSITKQLHLDKLFSFVSKAISKDIPKDILNHFTHKKKKCETLGQKAVWKGTIALYNKCDVVISPSHSIKRLIVKKGISKRTEVISNGIDTKLFSSKKKYNKKITQIVHVGRISFEKQVSVILKAFQILIKKNPCVKLSIIGGGPALESLKQEAVKLGISDNTYFSGYVKYDKLPAIYRKSDLFVTASTMETQGLVIIEAMSTGLPVIGVNKYAIPDVITNNENGYVVPAGNSVQMAKAFDKLVNNPKLVEKLGKNATKDVRCHDLDVTADVLEKTYKSLI